MTDQLPRKIGGFQGLELPFAVPDGKSAWDHMTSGACQLIERTSARSALAFILATAKPNKIWLPAYTCPEMFLRQFSDAIRFYPVGSGLKPDTGWLDEHVNEGDAIVAINFFGAPADDQFRLFVSTRPDLLWLEDCAQALAPGPHWGDWIIYSPRKLFGVADGGIGVCRAASKHIDYPVKQKRLDVDSLLARLAPVMCRFEDEDEQHNDIWYAQFQKSELLPFSTDTDQTYCSLSRLTRQILQSIDADHVIERRRQNAAQLHDALPETIRFWQQLPEAPLLGYPVLLNERDHVSAQLIDAGIFCPVHWRGLPSPRGEFAAEHDLSQTILTLPCDQRYGPDDMERVCNMLLAAV